MKFAKTTPGQMYSKATDPVKSTQPTKKINPAAISALNYITLNNIRNKITESFRRFKIQSDNSVKRCVLMSQILKSIFRRKSKQYTKTVFALFQSQRLANIAQQLQYTSDRNVLIKEKSLKIMLAITNKWKSNLIKNTFREIKQKTQNTKLLTNYRTQVAYNAIKGMLNRKVKLGLNALVSFYKASQGKYKAIRKISNIFIHKTISNKNSAITNIKYIGSKRIPKQPSSPNQKVQKTVKVSEPKRQSPAPKNIYAQQYRKLQMQFQSLQAQQQAILQSHRLEIEELEKRNEALKFNYQCLESNNNQMQREIEQNKIKYIRKITIGQVWEQIYKNFLFFLYNNKQKIVNKEELLSSMQIPLGKLNGINLQMISEENVLLQDLIHQYNNLGMIPPQLTPQINTQGIVPFKDLPYDVIVRSNRYLYQVVEVLANKGLGRTDEIDSLKRDLDNMIVKLKSN